MPRSFSCARSRPGRRRRAAWTRWCCDWQSEGRPALDRSRSASNGAARDGRPGQATRRPAPHLSRSSSRRRAGRIRAAVPRRHRLLPVGPGPPTPRWPTAARGGRRLRHHHPAATARPGCCCRLRQRPGDRPAASLKVRGRRHEDVAGRRGHSTTDANRLRLVNTGSRTGRRVSARNSGASSDRLPMGTRSVPVRDPLTA